MKAESPVGWIVTLGTLVLLLLFAGGIALETSRLTDHPDIAGGAYDQLWIALAVMLLVGFLFAVSACSGELSRPFETGVLPWIGLGAFCLAAAHWRSYDDYSLPTLVRISNVTTVPTWSFVALALGAVFVGAIAALRPRAGLLVQGVFLWIVAIWTFFLGPFH